MCYSELSSFALSHTRIFDVDGCLTPKIRQEMTVPKEIAVVEEWIIIISIIYCGKVST